jgi:large subunit ribosomal protein L6
MSKIANRIIPIPINVKVNLGKETFFAEGPLGRSEELTIPATIKVVNEENKLFTKSENIALAGTYNSLIYNIIKGVAEGYEKVLEVKGIGYKVSLKDKVLEFSLGKSHLIHISVPLDLEVKVEGSKIIIKGINKQKVNKFAANDIRPLRPPSVYKKSKGIYYIDEEKSIKLKPGKSLNKK